MKVIITGVTGFIGTELLKQCIQSSAVSEIVTLSRKALPKRLTENPKVLSIIHEDFLVYPEELLNQLSGAEACFWCLGITRFTPNMNTRLIDVEYPQAASRAFETNLAPQLPKGKKFSFLFVSGIFAEKDQSRSLWFIEQGRKSKGESEVATMEFGLRHPDTWESYAVRAGVVLSNEGWTSYIWPALFSGWFIRADQLALAMLGIVVEHGPSRTFENPQLVSRGRKALAVAASSATTTQAS